MESKFNTHLPEDHGKPHIPKFQIKPKPRPILFNGNSSSCNGISSPAKKPKLENNASNSSSSSNGNAGGLLNKGILNAGLKRKLDIAEQRKKLPVFQHKKELLESIRKHHTLVILSETGSGKTTQIPQYIWEAKLHNEGKIGITQPRRVAAISVAVRVAQELGNNSSVGDDVGYTVRFENVTSKRTKIKYLTDGMLLREAMSDPLLLEYSFIMLDEAHERTINTDILFGVVKQAQKVRQDKKLMPLKIIIMSATIDVDHFSKYFNNCEVIFLEGRTYPINMRNAMEPQDDYMSASIATFFKIHCEAPPNHDVLIFLTGQEEIEMAAHQIRLLAKDAEVKGPPVKVCALYAAQPSSQQMLAFQPAAEGTRKVVVCTNIAETSVTISGIKHVIDSGMVKMRTYHAAAGLDMLKVQRISQEQAWQRAGRAGRESEGYCYRLYTRKQFDQMQKSTPPEILRANLNSVVLQLLALGIDALNFDFMDKPPREALLAAYENLRQLGAIEGPESKHLTALGRKMAKFPLEPRFSKMILTSQEFGCVSEILTVVALLSAESIYISPVSKLEQAQSARKQFYSPYGDLVTLLNILKEYNDVGQKNKRTWCYEHFINIRNLQHVFSIREQLSEICEKCEINCKISCGSRLDRLRKCLISGLFNNVALLHKDRQYVTLDKRQMVSIHPGSVINSLQPHAVLFTEVVQTGKCYMRNLTTIESDWLEEVVPDYMRSRNARLNSIN